MFREMQRKKQMLSVDECIEILNKGTSGVLALSGDHDYPYVIPISYVYCNSKLCLPCTSSHIFNSLFQEQSRYSPPFLR